MAENPGGDCQGVEGEVESPRGIDTPGVEELPWGDETSRVTPEGDGVAGADVKGQGGERNSPATRDTKAREDSSTSKEMASRPGPAASQRPHSPQQCMAKGGGSKVSMYRNSDSAHSARREHVALVRHEYSLLAPEELVGYPDAAEPRDCGDSPKATIGTGVPDKRATETGNQNGQCALLTCGQLEDTDVERGPPEQQCALNVCGHQGGRRGGTPHPAVHTSCVKPGEGGGHPDQAARPPSA